MDVGKVIPTLFHDCSLDRTRTVLGEGSYAFNKSHRPFTICTTITTHTTARSDQAIVRGQLVATNFLPTCASGFVAIFACKGTDNNTVQPSATANRMAPIQGKHQVTPTGCRANKASVVNPSTAIGNATT